jgi:probable F420-dependent oxidoreductase
VELGIAFLGSPADAGRLALAAEDVGADAFLVGETEHSALACAIAAAVATTEITVGTNISIVFARSPVVCAMEAWSLGAVAPGRCLYGLGSQIRPVVERRFGADFERPIRRMAEYAEVMRRSMDSMRGRAVEPFEGELLQITQLGFHGVPEPEAPLVPLHLAAVGPQMLRLGARSFDGILGHAVSTVEYLDQVVRPAIGDTFYTGSVFASIDADGKAARAAARRSLAFYGTTPAYEPPFMLGGWGEVPPQLRRAFREKDHARMDALITDEMLDAFVLAGTPDEVASRLDRYSPLVDRLVLGGIGIGATREEIVANNQGLIDVIRRYRMR